MKAFYSLLIWVLAFSLSGCTSSIEDICNKEIPEFEAEILAMVKDIPIPFKSAEKDHKTGTSVRKPASVPFVTPPAQQIHTWKSWSRERLDDVQDVIDVVGAQPSLLKHKSDLTLIANELVMFYGYVESGKWTRMQESIDVILLRSEAVKKGVCHAASGELPAPQSELSRKPEH